MNLLLEYLLKKMKKKIKFILDINDIKNANLKVVVDCGSGAGSFTAPYILRKLGCEVTTLNCQADGFFPGRNPEPIEPNLTELINTVKILNCIN